MNESNLKQWKPGQSGNPHGRPKGSRNIKSLIRDMVQDPETYKKLQEFVPWGTETPLEAIICATLVKAMQGDVRATEVILKHVVDDTPISDQSTSFFSSSELRIVVIKPSGETIDSQKQAVLPEIKEGQLVSDD